MDTAEAPKAKKKEVLTRAQQRRIKRVNEEVYQTINQLSDQFMDFFMAAEDPQSKEVVNKMTEISAKWRIYCKRKNLIAGAYPVMDKQMNDIVSDYLKKVEAKKLASPVAQKVAKSKVAGFWEGIIIWIKTKLSRS
jgi:hypothetical protein